MRKLNFVQISIYKCEFESYICLCTKHHKRKNVFLDFIHLISKKEVTSSCSSDCWWLLDKFVKQSCQFIQYNYINKCIKLTQNISIVFNVRIARYFLLVSNRKILSYTTFWIIGLQVLLSSVCQLETGLCLNEKYFIVLKRR